MKQLTMIPDSHCNRVYFSAKMPEVCPVTFKGLAAVLDKYAVPYTLLEGTNDIWCRDYMPVQVGAKEFVSFGYQPDYLINYKKYRPTVTDGYESAKLNGITGVKDLRHILVDGGNLVHCGGKVIMTCKVFEENPGMGVEEICRTLRENLGAEIIFLPWDTEEIYGHTDGIVRFVDEDSVIMTNYAQFDPMMAARFRKILMARFKNVFELSYDVAKRNDDNWAYINWLQTDKVLILPKFNTDEDEQAYEQISRYMPQYKDRIEMVDATDLICHEGGLNCASWTVYEPNED
ncbi:MAG: agmatine deiminase family protein [Bacteroidales bacterium]|nr:agmatine deiminase family protein [Bacteroidales bacterium]